MALSLTLDEFTALFPLGTPAIEITEEHFGDVHLDQHAVISGVVHGDIWVPNDVSAEITGVVHGSVAILKGGLAYISGTVSGTVDVAGAALITGEVEGKFQAGDYAAVSAACLIANRC